MKKKTEPEIIQPETFLPTTHDEMSILLDNIIKYFQAKEKDEDESEKWKKTAGIAINENIAPDNLNKLIMDIFELQLNIILIKEENELKSLQKNKNK